MIRFLFAMVFFGWFGSVHATLITWNLDLIPEVDNTPPSISEGSYLVLTFDDQIILQGSNTDYFFAHRRVIDLTLFINGLTYNAGNHIDHGAGVLAVSQNTSDYFGQNHSGGDFDRLILDLYLENGGRFYWDLSTFSELHSRLFPVFGFTDIPTSQGILEPIDYWQNVVQTDLPNGTSPDGRVTNWILVSEPSVLALMGLGLLGLFVLSRKKAP